MNAPHLTTLADKAMLIRVKLGVYSAYAFDAEATARAYGTSKVGRANKHLLKESRRLKGTTEAFNAIRTAVNQRTTPWLDEGTRLFKNEDYLDMARDLAVLQNIAESFADDLATNWHNEVLQDQLRFGQIGALNGTPSVFDATDYPDANQLRDRFYCEIRYMPVPDTGDFRVELGAEQTAAFERTIREAEEAAQKYALTQMVEPTAALIRKLGEFKGDKGQRWHESLISNVLEVTKRIRFMNISDDPAIYAVSKELEQFILPYSFAPTELKENPDARTVAKAKLEEIMGRMGGFMGGA